MGSSYLLYLLIFGGCIAFTIVMRRRLNTRYAHMRAGELCTRLGLAIAEGDPQHNLVTMSVLPTANNVGSAKGMLRQVAATNFGGKLGEFKLHATGTPYGVPAELLLYVRQEYAVGVIENTTTTWSDLRLTVRTRTAVPPFELRLRAETTHLEARREGEPMPPQRFGDALLDQRYLFESYDPALPARLANALATLPPHLVYVHVVGSGTQISFVMTPAAVNATALELEPILHALADAAATVDGRSLVVAA